MDWNGLGLVAALYSRDKDLAALVSTRRVVELAIRLAQKPFSYSFRSKTPHIRVPVSWFHNLDTQTSLKHIIMATPGQLAKAPSRKTFANPNVKPGTGTLI